MQSKLIHNTLLEEMKNVSLTLENNISTYKVKHIASMWLKHGTCGYGHKKNWINAHVIVEHAECCFLLKLVYWKPPQGDSIGAYGHRIKLSHIYGALINGVGMLIRDLAIDLFFSLLQRNIEKSEVCNHKDSSPESNHTDTLLSNFHSAHLCKIFYF